MNHRQNRWPSAPGGIKGGNPLQQFVLNHILASIHPKLWVAGLIFSLAVWYRVDFGYLFMAANCLGLWHIFFVYWQARGDCENVRGAMFRFGVYTGLAFAGTTFTFLIYGRQLAVYCGYLVYGLITIDYLFSFWHMAIRCPPGDSSGT